MPFDPHRVRAICFDVDGTISDTDNHVVERVAGFLGKLPFLSGRHAALLARRLVMDAETPVNRAYGLSDRLGIDDELARARTFLGGLSRRFRQRAEADAADPHDEVPHEMVADVKEAIERLAERYPMCTVSTGSAARVEAFLAHHGVAEHFAAVITAQTTPRMKPFPDPVLHAAEVMGVPPEACVMVGDTTVDILAGVRAGAQTVGVLCGFGTEDELRREGADLVLPTTSDLLAVLMPERTDVKGTAAPEQAPRADAPEEAAEGRA